MRAAYMYAQHYLEGSPNGDFYLARGTYENHMLRTPDGWRIERVVQQMHDLDRRAGKSRIRSDDDRA